MPAVYRGENLKSSAVFSRSVVHRNSRGAHGKKVLSRVMVWGVLVLIFWCSTCQASELTTITIVETMPVPVVQNFSRNFVKAVEKRGYENGKDCNIIVLEANGSRERATSLLTRSMREHKPDLVVSIATLASQAVRVVLRGTDIPQFFGVVADPVGAGLVEKVGVATGDTLTGLVAALPRESQLRFAATLATQVRSDGPVRIGVVSSDYPSSLSDLRLLKEAAEPGADIVFKEFIFPYREMPGGLNEMLDAATLGLESLEEEVDFWWEVSGPLGEVPDFFDLILAVSRKPVLYGNTIRSVQKGALFGMIQNVEHSAEEAATLAVDILRGADPGLIPVRAPSAFELGINLTTALEQGIVIPAEMMELAGDKVYR